MQRESTEARDAHAYTGFRPGETFLNDVAAATFGREILGALELLGVAPRGEFLLMRPKEQIDAAR